MPTTRSDEDLIPLPRNGPVVAARVCGFLAGLEDQRIRLTVDTTGRLLADPRGALDDAQRAFIRQHRADVVKVLRYLADVEVGQPC